MPGERGKCPSSESFGSENAKPGKCGMQQQQQGKQTNKQWPKSPMVIVVGNSQAREKAGLWSKSTTKVKESKVIGKGGNESLQKVWVKKATNNIYFYLNILHLRRRNHLFLWNISNK